jgi:antitoxin ParD1/3/4
MGTSNWYFDLPKGNGMSRNTSVVLGDHYQHFIERQVAEGRYGSASEVIRAGLRLLEDYESRVIALGRAIEEGLASGPAVPLDFDRFIAEARAE